MLDRRISACYPQQDRAPERSVRRPGYSACGFSSVASTAFEVLSTIAFSCLQINEVLSPRKTGLRTERGRQKKTFRVARIIYGPTNSCLGFVIVGRIVVEARRASIGVACGIASEISCKTFSRYAPQTFLRLAGCRLKMWSVCPRRASTVAGVS